ncbi:HEAT repeat domain-containing protein [bacterium]|nr:HEAT repeat domain-containing protein [bacterium]
MYRIIIFILVVMVTVSSAQFYEESDSFPPAMDSVAWSYLDSAIYYSGGTKYDPEFEKKWAGDTLFRLPVVERILDHPLELPDTIDSWTRYVLDHSIELSSLTRWAFSRIDIEAEIKQLDKIENKINEIAGKDTTGSGLGEKIRQPVRILLASFDVASLHRQKMLASIPEGTLDSLLQLLPLFWTDGEDSAADTLECYFIDLLGHECDTSKDIHLDSLYEAIAGIDLQELELATYALARGVELAVEMLTSESIAQVIENKHLLDTRWGKVVIGSNGTDIFDGANIILDPGGNDIYFGEASSGVIGRNEFGVTIDLGGNDYYDSRGSVFSQGSGVFGVGILADVSGDDIYTASHYSQGSGLFGSGLLIDFAGDDQYSSGVFVQGAGNFGIGLIIDVEGEDSYRSYEHAQGFAGPAGMGLSIDMEGADGYYSGGKYSHDPLAPFDYHSFAQGFSIGWRPDVSGGIGFLFDKSGNDTYTTGVYGQGVSYWYALGLLVDNSGNDVYTSVWYPQGSGIHLSIGALVDRGGNDVYVSPQGPGQGSAHDYSVGFLSEYQGDDMYIVDGGQGTSLTNSFVLFLDRNGDDMYAKRKEGSINWAYGRGARGTGSYGIFLDLEGSDYYSDKEIPGNEHYWFQGELGIGIDIKGVPFPDPVQELAEELADEEPDSGRTIEDVFRDASTWGVGSKAKKAENAFQELLDSGEVAAAYICDEQLGTKSSLKLRVIKRFSDEKRDLMRPCLYRALHEREKKERFGNSVYLLGEMQDTMAVDSLLPLLQEKKYRISVISALGKIKDTTAIPHILKWKDEERQSARYIVAKALADIKDARGIPALLDFLNDDYLIVRQAAQIGIQNMYKETFPVALKQIPIAKNLQLIHLIRAIPDMCRNFRNNEDYDSTYVEARYAQARKALLPLIDNPNNVVRGHAVMALGMLKGDETLSELRRKYEFEPDAFVRSMYRYVLEMKK